MSNFPERQTHFLLVIGVAVIEVAFFTVIAAVGGNSSAVSSYLPTDTRTTLTSNVNTSTSTQTSTVNASQSNSSKNMPSASVDPSALKEVEKVLDDWKSTAEAHDLDAYMNHYADTIDYYKAKGWSRSRVRADKQRAFSAFDNLQISLENISVSLDSTGERAVAVMDKNWTFTGTAKSTNGSVQQQMTFIKIGGRWLISGEKDLKVYNSRSY